MRNSIKNNFWNHAYRHNMRGLKPSIVKEIHNLLKEWDLKLNGVSDLHEELIVSCTGEFKIQGEADNCMSLRMDKTYI